MRIWLLLLILLGPYAQATPLKCFVDLKSLPSASLPDQELLARLVFAESISTNFMAHQCEPNPIFNLIAWGVMNRVNLGRRSKVWAQKYGATVSQVIFKKGQFNPAISAKSQFSTLFACPTDSKDFDTYWPLSVKASQTALKGESNPFLITDWEKQNNLSLVSHFYYPKSVQATKKPPAWADMNKIVKELSNQCLWFFRLEEPIN